MSGGMSDGMSGSGGSGGFGRSRSGGENQADGMKWACWVMVMAWWERGWCPGADTKKPAGWVTGRAVKVGCEQVNSRDNLRSDQGASRWRDFRLTMSARTGREGGCMKEKLRSLCPVLWRGFDGLLDLWEVDANGIHPAWFVSFAFGNLCNHLANEFPCLY